MRVLWMIWQDRNSRIFEGVKSPQHGIIQSWVNALRSPKVHVVAVRPLNFFFYLI